MTIDEKIKQAAEKSHIKWLMFLNADPEDTSCKQSSSEVFFNAFHKGAEAMKSEMLADMQKLADALEFYADESSWSISETYKQFNRIDDQDLEYKSGCGRYDLLAGKKARQALAEFNAKYKEQK